MMIDDDMNFHIENMINKLENILIHNCGEFLGTEEIKMRICYPIVTPGLFSLI